MDRWKFIVLTQKIKNALFQFRVILRSPFGKLRVNSATKNLARSFATLRMTQGEQPIKSINAWGLILAGLCLLFLAVRLTVLLSAGSYAFEVEELYRGAIAKEMITGLKMPLLNYQADHYSGGSLVIGALAVPFFLLFGTSLFALKLAPLSVALGTLILMFVFIRKHFGTPAAVWASLLFIIAPPSFTQLSLVAMGFHSESIIWSIGIVILFYRYFFCGRSAKTLFLFGLICGLGFWFTHIVFNTIAACLASWLFLDRKSFFNRQNLVRFIGGGMLGMVPWVFYNLTHQ